MQLDQTLVKNELISLLKKKKDSILDLQFSTIQSNDVKSSAGDKHETSVAMAHLEQEKIANQLQLVESMLTTVNKLAPISTIKIQLGHLILTSSGWYFLSVGFGKIEVNDENIYCLSSQSPIGQLLLGKKLNDKIHWQGKSITILEIH
jgi:hypothetical protein